MLANGEIIRGNGNLLVGQSWHIENNSEKTFLRTTLSVCTGKVLGKTEKNSSSFNLCSTNFYSTSFWTTWNGSFWIFCVSLAYIIALRHVFAARCGERLTIDSARFHFAAS
jgi:hypothetical protein